MKVDVNRRARMTRRGARAASKPERSLLAWTLRQARPHLRALTGCLLLLLTLAALDLSQPYIIKLAIDRVMEPAADAGPAERLALLDALRPLVAAYLLAVLGVSVTDYAQRLWLGHTGQQIILDLRNATFAHLQALDLSYFDSQPDGRIVTRVTNDIEALNELYTSVLVNFFRDVFVILGTVVLLLQLDVRLALVAFAVMPVVALTAGVFQRFSRRAWQRSRIELARINARLAETFSGVRVIQIFGREAKSGREFAAINEAYYDASMQVIRVFSIFGPVLNLLTNLALALVIWVGGGRLIEGAIGFGTLYAFTAYLRRLFDPLNGLAEKYNLLQSALAAAERISELLDTEPALADPAGRDPDLAVGRRASRTSATGASGAAASAAAPAETPALAFEDVWFAYEGEDWVLRGVSFEVGRGETVAFVGHTGAGKTTIMNLLPRFYDVQRGRVLVEGLDVRRWPKRSLRQHVGCVLQEVFLFAGDLRDNIALGDARIGRREAEAVAEAVGADRFIRRLPAGYDEPVVERGMSFSAGQRQLLAFARALAQDPEVLILDEATASVDTETEEALQQAMRRLASDRTTLIVAHRLATVRDADRIHVMERGRIVESGRHAELLEAGGIYQRLWSLQLEEGAPSG